MKMMELLLLVIIEAGHWGVLVGILWLFRDYLRISLAFGKATNKE